MDTIPIELDGQTIEVPVVVAFGPNGKPMELIGDVEPQHCDHVGAVWSDCLAMRCPRCGSRLFMPPSKLARLPETQIEDMHAAWVAAGWPRYAGGGWQVGAGWMMTPHPAFMHVGGLPMRAG